MTRQLFAILISYSLLIPVQRLLSGCRPAHLIGDTIIGKAIRIMDGDTFELLIDHCKTERIRLYGIDCPEKSQSFSNNAKEFLAELIFSKSVKIIRMGTDRYGRTVAMVLIDSVNVNESLLKNGLAWHFSRYDQNPKWAKMEHEAISRKLGLWADDRRIPPWEWRKNKN